MSYPYFDLVLKAQSDLLDAGLIAVRTNQEQIEEDKGLLTRRAGYYSNLKDATIGLLAKTSGNNSLGYSVDVLIKTDGMYWDIATDKNGLATPVNGESKYDFNLIPLWRMPTAELAQVQNLDLSKLAPFYDEQKSVAFGLACNDVYTESHAPIDPGMISVQSQRCAYDYFVKGLSWDASFKKHINELRAIYGLPPIT